MGWVKVFIDRWLLLERLVDVRNEVLIHAEIVDALKLWFRTLIVLLEQAAAWWVVNFLLMYVFLLDKKLLACKLLLWVNPTIEGTLILWLFSWSVRNCDESCVLCEFPFYYFAFKRLTAYLWCALLVKLCIVFACSGLAHIWGVCGVGGRVDRFRLFVVDGCLIILAQHRCRFGVIGD